MFCCDLYIADMLIYLKFLHLEDFHKFITTFCRIILECLSDIFPFSPVPHVVNTVEFNATENYSLGRYSWW